MGVGGGGGVAALLSTMSKNNKIMCDFQSSQVGRFDRKIGCDGYNDKYPCMVKHWFWSVDLVQ